MRKTHIGAALLAAIIVAASCGDTPNPVAPTPTPTPELPIPTRTLEIIGLPEDGRLPAGEVTQLTAQIRQPNGETHVVIRPKWTSSDTKIAIVEELGEFVGLMVGHAEITADHYGVSAMAQVEITPPQPNELLWREIAFNYNDCRPTDPACGIPLETRWLRVLPVTSPNFAIVSHTLNDIAIANLHEVLAFGVEQITGKPYRGTIQEGNGVHAENWITIEGVKPGKPATAGSCVNRSLRDGATATATLGAIFGCIMLGMHNEQGSGRDVILHELGHAMGFSHTSDTRTLMFRTTGNEGRTFSALEQYHTQLAYRHPRGTTYTEIKISTFGPQRPTRPRHIDAKPVFIVD